MKKIKTILLSSALSLSLLGGCSGKKAPEQSAGKTLMNGFEVFDRDIQLIRMFNDFGRLDENDNAEFVHSGKKSLKITPFGSRVATANPYIVLPTYSLRFEEVSYGDFSNVDSISFWFYNNEEEIVNVGVGFATGILRMSTADRRDVIKKTNVEYFSLSKGWNYIKYTVEPAYLALQNLNIKEVYGVVLEFDYVPSDNVADAPEIYLDDVELAYTANPKSAQLNIEVETGKTESGNDFWQISDFENPLETYYYSYYYEKPAPYLGHPVIKSVFAGNYGVKTTKGTQALLIQKKHGGGKYGWPSLKIHGEVIRSVFKKIGEDVINNPQNYAFKFDLYNASDFEGGFGVYYEKSNPWSSITVESGRWKTFSITIKQIDDAMQEGADAFSKNPGNINFAWNVYTDEEDTRDRPFLLDNVRIEKIG